MKPEETFAAALEEVRTLARKQGNRISEEQVREQFKGMAFDDAQLKLIYDYLSSRKIRVEKTSGQAAGKKEYSDRYVNYLKEAALMGEAYPGERAEVLKAAMAGQKKAGQRLMEMTLIQVTEIARLYEGQGVLVDDLVGEGNLAMADAVSRLSGVATPEEAEQMIATGIMNAMEEYVYGDVEELEAVSKVADKVNEVADKARELAEAYGRKVTVEELADETQLKVYEILEAYRWYGESIEDLEVPPDAQGTTSEGASGGMRPKSRS